MAEKRGVITKAVDYVKNGFAYFSNREADNTPNVFPTGINAPNPNPDAVRQKQMTDIASPPGSGITSSAVTQISDHGIFKAYIPNFLYRPPYGMPRNEPVQEYKQLAKNAFVFSVIKTICDEATAVDWSVRVKEEYQEQYAVQATTTPDKDLMVDVDNKIKEVTKFFKNPNGNEESLEHILRAVITDILEADSGVIVKVFNIQGEFQQMFARDGTLFLKNPDIYGYLGDRADFVMPLPDGFTNVSMNWGEANPTQNELMKQYSLLYKDRAAYFQYGWTAGSMPVPFGKREVVYMMQMPRGDTIYGTSAMSRLYEVIWNLIYGVDAQLDLFTNNNVPKGVIQLLGAKREQIDQFRANFNAQFKFKDQFGNERRKFHVTPISTVPVEYTPFSISAKEMDFIAQQNWFTKVLWMCFGVTADEMGITDNSNRATAESQVDVAKRKAIKPILDVIEYHFNTQIMPEFFAKNGEIPSFSEIPLEFVFDNYDIKEDMKKHELLEKQINMGIKTVEMAAKEIGVNVEELEASRAKESEAKLASFTAQQEAISKFGPKEEETPQVEEKSLNPLAEIDSYIDNIGQDVIKAVEKMDERELEFQF